MNIKGASASKNSSRYTYGTAFAQTLMSISKINQVLHVSAQYVSDQKDDLGLQQTVSSLSFRQRQLLNASDGSTMVTVKYKIGKDLIERKGKVSLGVLLRYCPAINVSFRYSNYLEQEIETIILPTENRPTNLLIDRMIERSMAADASIITSIQNLIPQETQFSFVTKLNRTATKLALWDEHQMLNELLRSLYRDNIQDVTRLDLSAMFGLLPAASKERHEFCVKLADAMLYRYFTNAQSILRWMFENPSVSMDLVECQPVKLPLSFFLKSEKRSNSILWFKFA